VLPEGSAKKATNVLAPIVHQKQNAPKAHPDHYADAAPDLWTFLAPTVDH